MEKVCQQYLYSERDWGCQPNDYRISKMRGASFQQKKKKINEAVQ